MDKKLPRREFLVRAPATAGMLAAAQATSKHPLPGLGSKSGWRGCLYPKPDYPRQTKRISEVTLRDNFWKPKIRINARSRFPWK